LAPLVSQQLKQLKDIYLNVNYAEQQQLLQLAELPALQHLSLSYWQGAGEVRAAAATATAWAALPQLLVLHVDVEEPATDLDAIMEGRQQPSASKACL
jgi:hypothetical protein